MTLTHWLTLGGAALLIGLAKTGLTGISMIALPLVAAIFGGRESSGMILVLLILGDLFGVRYYHAHAHKPSLIKLLPWAVIGVVLGTLVGGVISDRVFQLIMAILIMVSISIIIVQEFRKTPPVPPDWPWLPMVLGILGGFTTMIGNAAGPIMTLYLLSMSFNKNEMIGTGAWFFFLINLIKVPFHIFIWQTIRVETLTLVLPVAPLVVVGAFLGVRIVTHIPEKPYRYFVICMTLLAAGRLLFYSFRF